MRVLRQARQRRSGASQSPPDSSCRPRPQEPEPVWVPQQARQRRSEASQSPPDSSCRPGPREPVPVPEPVRVPRQERRRRPEAFQSPPGSFCRPRPQGPRGSVRWWAVPSPLGIPPQLQIVWAVPPQGREFHPAPPLKRAGSAGPDCRHWPGLPPEWEGGGGGRARPERPAPLRPPPQSPHRRARPPWGLRAR